jgi:competence protein ComEC
MGSISLVALAYGDRVDSFRILLFTAVVLTLLSPLSLIYDAGFQLSFLATLGILVSIRVFKKRGILLQALGVSIFAGIWTLPISIGTF